MPFQDLPARLVDVRGAIADARSRGGHGQLVTVVGVTKTYRPEAPLAAWEAGLHDVGENKVREATGKMGALETSPDVSLRWHLIGHLQRNKVKELDGFHLVHSMDSERLANALSAYGTVRGRPLDVLVQVNVSGETSKGGYEPLSMEREAERLRLMDGLVVRGVMTMAPFDADESTVREIFGGARRCAEQLRAEGHPASELSMGMSGDYLLAVEEGATLVRLGTVLFGARSA